MCTTGKDDFQIGARLCFVNRLACVNLTCVWERQRKENGSVEEGEMDSVTEIELGRWGRGRSSLLDVLILVLEFAEVHEVISATMIVFCYLGQLAPVPPTRNPVELIHILFLKKHILTQICE